MVSRDEVVLDEGHRRLGDHAEHPLRRGRRRIYVDLLDGRVWRGRTWRLQDEGQVVVRGGSRLASPGATGEAIHLRSGRRRGRQPTGPEPGGGLLAVSILVYPQAQYR